MRGSQLRQNLTFSSTEIRDLAVAWAVMAAAFAIFFGRPERLIASVDFAILLFAVSAITVGTGFLLHELAHKVVAIRFGQLAEFRANYGMLFVAVMSAFIGFIVAAPGAVHHRGRISQREHGMVALAGPVTNLVLVLVFAPFLFLGGFFGLIGVFGVMVNAFLAAFNMLPFGPLDGKTVWQWNRPVFVATFAVAIVMTVGSFMFI